ncbi:MAG: hypothetical protein ACTHME_05190 [Candidatus Nitrosocosmicus sp.]
MEFTPINYWKLSKRGKELFSLIEKIGKSSVQNIHLKSDDFNVILEGVPPSLRTEYRDGIPFMRKMIVRKSL